MLIVMEIFLTFIDRVLSARHYKVLPNGFSLLIRTSNL